MRPVEHTVRLIQFNDQITSTTVAILDNALINGRTWKVSSFEFTLAAPVPTTIELTMFGSAEQTSTKDIILGAVPVTLRFKTPRRVDYIFTPTSDTASPTVFVINTAAQVTFQAILRLVSKPQRDLTPEFAEENVVVGSPL